MGYIYIIRNTVNHKVYIGQTKETVQSRFKRHVYAANGGCHYAIYKAMRKYGVLNFYVQEIEKCSNELLNERETYWIAYYKSNKSKYGYSMTEGGSRQGPPKNKSKVSDK